MRIFATLAVLVGVALAACVVFVGIPAPLYVVTGLLLSGIPQTYRRRPKAWTTRVRTGELVERDGSKDAYGRANTYIGLHVECVKSGEEPVWIAGIDLRKDDHEDKIATTRAKAEHRAAVLNAVCR